MLIPLPSPEEKEEHWSGSALQRIFLPLPPMTDLGSSLNVRLLKVFTDGGEVAGRGGKARVRPVSESPHSDPRLPNRDKIVAGGYYRYVRHTNTVVLFVLV